MVTFSFLLLLSSPFIFRFILQFETGRRRKSYGLASGCRIIAFFHPNCNDGGGGERVLWRAVLSLLNWCSENRFQVHVLIYCNSSIQNSPEIMLNDVYTNFGIDLRAHALNSGLSFLPLYCGSLLQPKLYPVATIFCQCLAAMLVATECLIRFTPDIFFDTTGWAFTYLPAKIAGCKIATYVHYPLVCSGKLADLWNNITSSFREKPIGASLTLLKYYYYHIIVYLYKCMGLLTDVVMVNSKWTEVHMKTLWKVKERSIVLLYPPCDTRNIKMFTADARDRRQLIISVSKFRPEKNHILQLKSFALLHQQVRFRSIKFVIAGGCTNVNEEMYLLNLKQQCERLGLSDSVEFRVNLSKLELLTLMSEAVIGLHTMWCEHFGISIVEMMSAGVIVIAHRSGGPLTDIIGNATCTVGYLAGSEIEYADAMSKLLDSKAVASEVSIASREYAQRFSDETFDSELLTALLKVLPSN